MNRKLSIGLSETGTNCKAVFTCAEEACDILADISDRQCTLTVGASNEGQVKKQLTMTGSK